MLELTALRLAIGPLPILHGLDLALGAGERVGLVGESGCGKSLTALSIIGLQPAAARLTGSIRLGGAELLGQDEAAWCRVRGRRIAMVFQEPMTALNPVMSIGAQIAEGAIRQLGMSRAEADARTRALMARVRLPPEEFPPALYPHQLSGGQRQRVMLAMALACDPQVLIADEPTTALDVTVQAEILRLLDDIVRERGMALLLITHDLGVAAALTDRIAVMYAGRIVETGPTDAVFARMAHPYTRALLAARPQEILHGVRERRPLTSIPGQVPAPGETTPGCPFAPRCPLVDRDCRADVPPLRPVEPGHLVACPRPA
jgi:peptide/nickel transport system ATP-binding protein